MGRRATTPPTNKQCHSTLSYVKRSAKKEFVGVFESLEDGSVTVIITVVVIIVISLLFVIARYAVDKGAAEEEKKRLEAEKEELAREKAEADREKARAAKDARFLAAELKKKTAALDEELKSHEVDFQEIEFDDSESAILGKGAFGIVRRATFHGEAVAVKQIKARSFGGGAAARGGIFAAAFGGGPDDEAIDAFIAEIRIMTPLRHPNIIYFHGGVWSQGESLYPSIIERSCGIVSIQSLLE